MCVIAVWWYIAHAVENDIGFPFQLNEANETLQDPDKRAEYDKELARGEPSEGSLSQEEIMKIYKGIAEVMYGRPATDTELYQNRVLLSVLYFSSMFAMWLFDDGK